MHKLGIDFEAADKPITINPFDYKEGIISYIRKIGCPVCFINKTLSCSDAILAIESETPEGAAICNRVISYALELIRTKE